MAKAFGYPSDAQKAGTYRPSGGFMKKFAVESFVVLALAASSAALAQTKPIKIGEINSYSSIPQFTGPYRQGWQLAVEVANAAGGLLGRKVEVISRDDSGKPEEAIKHASFASHYYKKYNENPKMGSVVGYSTMQAIDQQSTMGAYVGKLDLRGAKGTMVQ
jgi:hypothetical protein